jgi:hypothetical protein
MPRRSCYIGIATVRPKPPEKTREELLDKVSNAREELVTVERMLERLKNDVHTRTSHVS